MPDPTTPSTPAAAPAAAPAAPPAVAPAAAPAGDAPAPVAAPAAPAATPNALEVADAQAAGPAELVVPKGYEAQAEELKKTVGELGLEGEKAQKFVETVARLDATRQLAAEEAFTAQDAKWAAELQADPEIGGAKFKGAMTDVSRALKRFGGTPAQGSKMTPLASLLHHAGLGNNPLVLKAFAAVGRSLADDTVSGTQKPAPAATERLSDAELFYGPTTPSNKEQ